MGIFRCRDISVMTKLGLTFFLFVCVIVLFVNGCYAFYCHYCCLSSLFPSSRCRCVQPAKVGNAENYINFELLFKLARRYQASSSTDFLFCKVICTLYKLNICISAIVHIYEVSIILYYYFLILTCVS